MAQIAAQDLGKGQVAYTRALYVSYQQRRPCIIKTDVFTTVAEVGPQGFRVYRNATTGVLEVDILPGRKAIRLPSSAYEASMVPVTMVLPNGAKITGLVPDEWQDSY